jgi:uncharacterized membrane protein
MLNRNLGSRSSREAARRSFERGVRAFLIRMRRAGVTFVGLMGALIVYSIAMGGVGFFMFMAAAVTISLAAFLVMFFPVRDRGRPDMREAKVVDVRDAVRLDRLASQTEDWLLERCRALPRQAAAPLDRIVDRLRDLQPSLATVPADSQIGGEAQRLIGKHLPSLVSTYLSLPPAERGFQADTNDRLAESLVIVADQMDDLCERVAEERRMGFETERRFIESRYSDDERLRLDRQS